MQIMPTTTFLHGRVRLVSGKFYEVPERFGGMFVGLGWAVEASAQEAAGQVVEVLHAQAFAADAQPAGELEVAAPAVVPNGGTLQVDDATAGQAASTAGE